MNISFDLCHDNMLLHTFNGEAFDEELMVRKVVINVLT
ncbi:hypothetical protein PA08_2260 [Cutibacterium modestum P08]|nr:hypothetical protein PA08_2260 [Cutibacterium modestum P08]